MVKIISMLSTPDEINTVVVFQKLLSSFVPDNLCLYPVAEQRIMKLRNNSWKRQRFFLKKERGWTSKLFCALSFPKSLFAVQWSVLCTARGLDAVFYEFSGIIIRRILTNHNARTI